MIRIIVGACLTGIALALSVSPAAAQQEAGSAAEAPDWTMPDAFKPCLASQGDDMAAALAECRQLLGSGRYGGADAAVLRFAVLYFTGEATAPAEMADLLDSIDRASLPAIYHEAYDVLVAETCAKAEQWTCAATAWDRLYIAGQFSPEDAPPMVEAFLNVMGAEEFAAEIERQIDKADDWAGPLILRAELHKRAGNTGGVLADLEKAADLLDSGATWALNTICWDMVTEHGAARQAQRACDKAAAGAPNDPAIWDSHGAMNLALGNYDRALADYDQALRLQADYSHARYGRGLVLRKMGRTAEGDADIAAAVASDPDLAEQYAAYTL